MHRSYALVLPERPGSFLEVARTFSDEGVDIRRTSYNRVVDSHTLFVEVEGDIRSIDRAEVGLELMGVLPKDVRLGRVELVQLRLQDQQGSLAPVLDLAERHDLDIAYIDLKTDDGCRAVQLGLYTEDQGDLDAFLIEVQRICPAERVPYDPAQRVIDNGRFYLSFARGLSERVGLTEEGERSVLVNANRIIQLLERTTNDPFKPFDYLNQYADMLLAYRGDAFAAATRVTSFVTATGIEGTCIEPPVGSDSWVFRLAQGADEKDLLFVVDTGYGCYHDEFLALMRKLHPDWDECRRELFVTHADIDHVGSCDLFDRVYATGETMDDFRLEHAGRAGYRMQNPTHRPYSKIALVLSGHETPWLGNFLCIGRRPEGSTEPIARCVTTDGCRPAELCVGPFRFEVWEGAGGHVCGETVLIDRASRICVSGDIFVNVHGETKPQSRFNALAPFLMTSVDTDPDLARRERSDLFGLLGPGRWQVLGGHGALFEYEA